MNLIERIHGRTHAHKHPHENEPVAHDAPFWVRHYDTVVNLVTLGRTRTVHRRTLSLADLHPGDAVLDVGCGTGILLQEAEKVVGPDGTAVGLDVEPEMIRQARRRAGKNDSQATFGVASIEQIPYPNNSFDVAFSTLMYHHLSEEAKGAGMAELERVLKPNGRLILVDINAGRRSILTSLPGHNQVERRDFVRHDVTAQMQSAGFTIIEAGAHPSRQLSYAIGRKGK